ncbi:MAG: hypothetical protein HXX17_06690 [Geobacteraceae bacterium]|nr:hypothetical protein [Geobacteraceae bacterium]
MRDYSERRQSRTAAPPRRPSVWPSVIIIILLMIVAFATGLGTGWYLWRPGGKFYTAPKVQTPPVAAKPESSLPSQGQPIVPSSQPQGQSAGDKSTGAPPLTFYDTLKKGNKELMGTGINQPKESPQTSPATSQPSQPGR